MWEIAFALSKWLLYGALSVALGGISTLLLWAPRGDVAPQVKSYLLPGCISGLLLSAVGFFLQVGAFAESGLPGMFDSLYLSILWQSPAGSVALMQSLGFLAATLAALCLSFDRRRFAAVLWLLGALLLLLPLGERGHTADTSLFTRLALSAHVAAAAFWMGALYPLWRQCRYPDPLQCRRVMEQFGQLAAWMVALLIVAGIFMLYTLLGGFTALVQTGYGLAMLAKIALVSGLLLFAAQNKWKLVPYLPATDSRLQRSIQFEILVGAGILLVTALLSTLIGPGH